MNVTMAWAPIDTTITLRSESTNNLINSIQID